MPFSCLPPRQNVPPSRRYSYSTQADYIRGCVSEQDNVHLTRAASASSLTRPSYPHFHPGIHPMLPVELTHKLEQFRDLSKRLDVYHTAIATEMHKLVQRSSCQLVNVSGTSSTSTMSSSTPSTSYTTNKNRVYDEEDDYDSGYNDTRWRRTSSYRSIRTTSSRRSSRRASRPMPLSSTPKSVRTSTSSADSVIGTDCIYQNLHCYSHNRHNCGCSSVLLFFFSFFFLLCL